MFVLISHFEKMFLYEVRKEQKIEDNIYSFFKKYILKCHIFINNLKIILFKSIVQITRC